MSKKSGVGFVMNGWMAAIIIFFTMILLVLFKPEVYSTILQAIMQVIEAFSDFTVFKQ